jgi:cell division protein FtsB
VSTRTRPSTEKAPDRRRGVLSALTEHWLPFLTAVLGLATALAGFYASRTTTELNRSQDNLASRDAQVQQLSDANRRLSDTNQRLEAENTRLRQQLPGAGSAADPGSSETPTSAPVGVFRQTGESPVVVGERFGIDLDSQAPNWGVSPTAPSDLRVSPAVQSVSGKKLAVVKDPPTLQDCEAQTVLRTFLTLGQTVVGQRLCVQTTEGRWASVRIVAIDASARTMSFRIVVWKLSTDP